MFGLIYVQFYFVTIATILGVGILGLPVTLSHSGFYPFLTLFTFSYLSQVVLVLVFTELLQIACFYVMQQETSQGVPTEALPLEPTSDMAEFSSIEEEEFEMQNRIAQNIDIPLVMPNLHMLGELFLNKIGTFCFDVCLGLSFVSVLISYALAGSQAFAEILHLSVVGMIPVFVWTLTLIIIFLQFLVQPVISVLTLCKGAMFIGCVVVTFLVGAKIDLHATNDFKAIQEPFLMGTVALGGIINIMPILFGRIKPNKSQIKKFNAAIIAGLTTCYILNIMWCWTILKIVPQENPCLKSKISHLVNATVSSTRAPDVEVCSPISLENSKHNGEIATIPLVDVILHHHQEFSFVAVITQFFIVVSITVSYLTFGSAMHHMVSGMVTSFWHIHGPFISEKCKFKRGAYDQAQLWIFDVSSIMKATVSIASFLAVYIVATANPRGFINVLDRVTSFSQNSQNAIFVPIMLFVVKRDERYSKLQLSFKLHFSIYVLYALATCYYTYAVIYDVMDWIKAILSTTTN